MKGNENMELNKLGNVQREDKAVYDAIMAEKKRQQSNIELIASENFVTEAVMEAQGSVSNEQIRRRLSWQTLLRRL